MDIIIEPYVSLFIKFAVDEVNLVFALVPFSIFANRSSGGYRSCLIVLDSLRHSRIDSRRWGTDSRRNDRLLYKI